MACPRCPGSWAEFSGLPKCQAVSGPLRLHRPADNDQPIHFAPTWQHVVIATGANQSVGNITCAGVSFCLALSSPEMGGGFFVSSAPSLKSAAWKFVKPQFSEIYNMSCPSPKLCVGASYGRIVYSRTPAGTANSWKSFQIGSKPEVIIAISCPSIASVPRLTPQGMSIRLVTPREARAHGARPTSTACHP